MHSMRSAGFRVAVIAGVAAIGAAGCQIETPARVSSTSETILGGTELSRGQFPTVVAIVVDQGQRGLCTGTLVAPDTILTAAHCVDPQTLGYTTQQQVTDATLVVFDATNLQVAGGAGEVVAAAETISHPGFNQPSDPDVGLIRLAKSMTDRTPSPINLNAAAAPVGVSVTMVGYGKADGGGAGVGFYLENKSSVTCASAGVSDQTFLCFNQQDGTGKCSGDSGGPSFAPINGKDMVVGITSFGDQNCEFFGADMRVDASRQFIQEHAPALLCGDDGFCEESCGSGGLPADANCSDCSVDDDCGGGEFCDEGFCTPKPLQPGGLGSPCGDGQPECASGICGSGPGGMRCTDFCDVNGSDCPSGFDCLSADDGTSGACWPADGDGGGCRAGGGSGPAAALLVLAAFALARRRRAG